MSSTLCWSVCVGRPFSANAKKLQIQVNKRVCVCVCVLRSENNYKPQKIVKQQSGYPWTRKQALTVNVGSSNQHRNPLSHRGVVSSQYYLRHGCHLHHESINMLTTWHAASEETLLKSSVLRFSKSDSPTAMGTVTVRLGLLMKDIMESSLLLLTMYLSPLLSTPLPFFAKFFRVWLGTPLGPIGLWSSSRHLSSASPFFFPLRQALLHLLRMKALTKAMPFWMRAIAICKLFVSLSSSVAARLSALNELSSRARKRFSTCQIITWLHVNSCW